MNIQAQVFRQGLAELDERCCWLKSKTVLLWKAAVIGVAMYLITVTINWMLGDLGTISSIDIPAELGQLVKDVTDSSSTINDSGSGVTSVLEAVQSEILGILTRIPEPVMLLIPLMITGIKFWSGEFASGLKIGVIPLLIMVGPAVAMKALGIDGPSSSDSSGYATFTSAVEDGRARDVEHQLKSIAQSGKSVDSFQVDYLLAQMIARYHGHPEVREGSFEKTREWYRYNSGIAKRFIDALVARQGQALFEIDAQNLSAIAHFVHTKPYPQAAIDYEASQSWKLAILTTLKKLLIGLLTGLIVLSTGIVLLRAILTRRAGRIRSLLGGSLESEKTA